MRNIEYIPSQIGFAQGLYGGFTDVSGREKKRAPANDALQHILGRTYGRILEFSFGVLESVSRVNFR